MKYFVIPDHENFKISHNGEIIHSVTNQRIKIESICVGSYYAKFVKIDGIDYDVDRLLLHTFVGDMPSEVITRYSSKHSEGYPDYQIKCKESKGDEFLLDNVRFRRIPNFGNYIVSSDGIVYSLTNHQFVRRTYNHAGYQVVTITRNDGYRSPQKVHRLVYSTYSGELIEGLVIDHIDGVRYHNNIDNLQQITNHENVRKAFYTGAAQHSSRWELKTIHKICEMLELGYANTAIANAIGYDYDNDRKSFNHLLFRLLNGIAYTDVTCMYDFTKRNSALNRKDRKLSSEDVARIKIMLSSGDKIANIAKEFNCTTSTIAKIRDGKTWKNIT